MKNAFFLGKTEENATLKEFCLKKVWWLTNFELSLQK